MDRYDPLWHDLGPEVEKAGKKDFGTETRQKTPDFHSWQPQRAVAQTFFRLPDEEIADVLDSWPWSFFLRARPAP